MKVKELIDELQKHDPEEEVVNGDGSNGFYEIEIKTIKDCIVEEYLEEVCEEYEISPNTIAIVSELC